MFELLDPPKKVPANDGGRELRGSEIAALANIEKMGDVYLVPSVSNPRCPKYRVKIGDKFSCTCEDFSTHLSKCKHIYAAEFASRRERSEIPQREISEKTIINKTRPTYSQNWSAYNAAQQNEKHEFQRLLADLCQNIVDETPVEKSKPGRPALALSDVVFAVVYKVYSTFSGRRFTSDLCDAQMNGFLSRVPHYNTAFRCMENPKLFPILLDLIEKSSLPLRSLESSFAVDSTGFAYSRFVRWFDIKYNRFSSEKQWIKIHICCGTKTNIVTAVEIGDKCSADPLHLPSLVESTAKNFDMKEVSADKGYSSGKCHEAVAKVGATPYIAFKRHANGWSGGVYTKMFHFFQLKRDEFLAHYHRRSNVESSMMMIKTKFGDSVRSKSEVAAKNEVLAKILCHNICCLISAMYELGITPHFGL
jgi:hypothetical protein